MRSSYIEDLAADIRRRVPVQLVPEDSGGLFLIYAALGLAKGDDVDARDVHNAWAAWMAARHPAHESIKPYDELPAGVRAEDEPFLAAIHEALRSSQSRG